MLLRFDPFRELDRAFDQLSEPMSRATPSVAFDAVRRGDHVVVRFDLPGVSPESIDLTVERDVLTLTAERSADRQEGDEVIVSERRMGRFTRRLFLGENLDTDHVEADYRDGVLTVTIPVAERAKARKVEIGSGEGGHAIETTTS
jgi:HSP20 family protein